jgi:hypothetical protein
VRKATDGSATLFRWIQQQKDQYQGIWIVNDAGSVLAGHHEIKDQKKWPEEVLATIDAGLAAFGELKPRDPQTTTPLPHRGIGILPGGGVQLAFYSRAMHRGRPDGPPVIDTLTLSAEEWAGLTPPKAEAGAEWTVPEAVARKFVRALSPSSDQSTMPKPGDATLSALKGRVGSVESGRAKILLTGEWASEHAKEGNLQKIARATATAEGTVRFDGERKTLESLLMVFSGIYRDAPPWDGPRETGAVVEWKER